MYIISLHGTIHDGQGLAFGAPVFSSPALDASIQRPVAARADCCYFKRKERGGVGGLDNAYAAEYLQ